MACGHKRHATVNRRTSIFACRDDHCYAVGRAWKSGFWIGSGATEPEYPYFSICCKKKVNIGWGSSLRLCRQVHSMRNSGLAFLISLPSDTLTTDHVQTPCLFCFCLDIVFGLFDSNSSPNPETCPVAITVLGPAPDVAGAAGELSRSTAR